METQQMPNPSVEFLFDFGSPNAYLCHKVLPDISRRTGVVIRYTPILLGGLFKLTNNRSPAQAYADIANKRAYQASPVCGGLRH
jgi:2-hydroxychromene-2-carboxylate isomerase